MHTLFVLIIIALVVAALKVGRLILARITGLPMYEQLQNTRHSDIRRNE